MLIWHNVCNICQLPQNQKHLLARTRRLTPAQFGAHLSHRSRVKFPLCCTGADEGALRLRFLRQAACVCVGHAPRVIPITCHTAAKLFKL